MKGKAVSEPYQKQSYTPPVMPAKAGISPSFEIASYIFFKFL